MYKNQHLQPIYCYQQTVLLFYTNVTLNCFILNILGHQVHIVSKGDWKGVLVADHIHVEWFL